MKLRGYFLLVLVVFFLTGCRLVFDIGLEEPPPDQAAFPIPSESSVTPINTPTPQLPTSTPTATMTEIPTLTPSPTPLPGLVVIPATSLGKDIPWLPLDRARWPTVFIVTINNQLPPFNNSLVRQAFAAAVDREAIAEMAEKYYAVDPSPATSFIPPQTLGRDLYREVGINFEPARAKELLVEAGYTDATSFPPVTFIVNSYVNAQGSFDLGARYMMAMAMAEMWKTHLGVTVNVQSLKPAVYSERIRTNPPELFWNGWLPDPGNDPNFIRDIFRTGAEFNFGQFSNAEFDSLVDRAGKDQDPAVRQALYIEAERLLCETEAGIIPLYFTFSNIP